MRREILFACLVIVSACQSGPEHPSFSAHDIEILETKYIDCLMRNAVALDDGQSDAGTIATAIEPNCGREFKDTVIAHGGGLNPAAFSLYERKAAVNQIQVVTGVVLKERSLRRRPSS